VSEAGNTLPVARSGKSAGAFRTTSEVAAELDLPSHVLRFWETKFPQVRPLKRSGGRRYYRPEDVALLRRIRSWLYQEGYTIRGVQKLLRDNSGSQPALPDEPELPIVPAPSPDNAARLRNALEDLRRDLRDIQKLLAGEGKGGS
jgi:DNA-binding transcriptional MerR regulator